MKPPTESEWPVRHRRQGREHMTTSALRYECGCQTRHTRLLSDCDVGISNRLLDDDSGAGVDQIAGDSPAHDLGGVTP